MNNSGLNNMFESCKPEFPPEPGMSDVLGQSYARSTQLAKQRRTRRVLLWSWSTAVVAVAAVAGVLASVLWPQGQGWATTDAYVLYFEVKCPSYIGVSNHFELPGPPHSVQQTVDEWALANRDSVPKDYDGILAYVSNWKTTALKQLVTTEDIEVTLISPNSDLLADLIEATSGIEHVSFKKVINKQYYYHEELSEVFERSDHRVTINGIEYKLPDDFTAEEAETLFSAIQTWSGHKGDRGYFMNYRLAEESRFDLGTLVLLELDDNLNLTFTTLRTDPLFPGLSNAHTLKDPKGNAMWNYSTWDQNNDMDEDTAIEVLHWFIEKRSDENNPDKQGEFSTYPAIEVVIPVLPPERWENAINGTAPAELSEAERATTRQRYLELEAVLNQWIENHPEYKASSGLEEFASCIFGSFILDYDPEKKWREQNHVVHSFKCFVYLPEDIVRGELLDALDTVDPVHPALVNINSHQIKRERTYWPDGKLEDSADSS